MAKTKSPPKSIEIKDVHGVAQATLPYLPEGGLIELRGRNGAGKSNILRCMDALGGQAEKLQRSDGKAFGLVEGLGRTIRITAGGNRKTGELEVHTLDDDLRVADLIDPKEKSAAAADRRALKALLRILRAKADVSRFVSLVESEADFRSVVPPEAFTETDLVNLAATVKGAFEATARAAENREKNLRDEVSAERRAAGDVDLNAPDDPNELQYQLEEALTRRTRLDHDKLAAQNAVVTVQTAQTKLIEATAKYRGPNVADAAIAWGEAAQHLVADEDAVTALRERLREAEAQLAQSRAEAKHRAAERTAAEQHERLCQGWRETIAETANIAAPADADIGDAADALNDARAAVELGVKVRAAKGHIAKAEAACAKADANCAVAARWRESARGTETVLSEILADLGGPIKVTSDERGDMRLVHAKHRRGECYWTDLSVGERTAIVVPTVIRVLQKTEDGLFVLDQPLWEGLDQPNRAMVVNLLTGSRVCCYTARATDGEIEAVVLTPESAGV